MRKASVPVIMLLVWSLVVLTSTVAFAASVGITPSGNGVFILQGYNFVNIGGVKATITYDQGALRNPKVEKGSSIANAPGSMFMPNANIPGQVTIAAINPTGGFNDGPIAIITFEKIRNSQHPITSLVPELSEVQGNIVKNVDKVGSEIVDENTSSTDTSSGTQSNAGATNTPTGTTTTGGTTGTTSSSSGTSWLGTVTLPGQEPERRTETTAKREEPAPTPSEDRRVAPSVPREADAPSAKREEPKSSGEKKFIARKSLLEQFKELKEPKTPQSLLALFTASATPGVVQEPPVALSDGKTKVTVHIDLPAVGKQSPNFALKGAKLVSLKNEDKDKWVIQALPIKNSNDVKITALQDDVMTEIPLVVAQPMAATAVTKDGKVDVGSFALFLKERGTEKAPQFDLNGDKVRDYVDEYIFTANYVVRNGIKMGAVEQPKATPKPAAAK